MTVFIGFKGNSFSFIFAFTAVEDVICGSRKAYPCTTVTLQFIFHLGNRQLCNVFRNQILLIAFEKKNKYMQYLNRNLIYTK